MNLIIWTLASVSLVSLISFVGLIALSFGEQAVRRSIAYFISFAAGTLFGNAFLHLLPAALHDSVGTTLPIFMVALGGIILFFIIETILHWHHCNIFGERPSKIQLGIMSIIGNSVDNFIDGVIIAGSFLVSFPLGITTTLAVSLHEIPQELSIFSAMLNAGFSIRKALIVNIFSAFASIAGAVTTLLLQEQLAPFKIYLLAFAAGGFIYIAGSDLLPDLPSRSMKENIIQILFLFAGIGVMMALHRLT